LGLLPQGAIVINVARGALIDELSLIEALHSGRLGGAGLDVFATEPLPTDSPLWTLPNVVVSPHFPNVRGIEQRVVQGFVENARRFVSGQRLLHIVDKRRGY
jgi:phosphoglycerate dehydrogenase-like enzyme